MSYFGSSINQSPVVAEKTGAAIATPEFKLVKLDANGAVVPCSATTDVPYGVIIPETADLASGDDVTVQISAIGLVKAGGAIAKGDMVSVNAKSLAQKANGNQYIFGVALKAATTEGDVIPIQITKAGTPSPVVTEKAGAAIANGALLFVQLDAAGDVILCDGTDDIPYGVLDAATPAAVADDDAVIVHNQGVVQVKAGEAIAKGNFVSVAADSFAQVAVATQYIFGVALKAAAKDGDVIDVLVTRSGFVPAAG